MHSTPEMLKQMVPQKQGFSIMLDENGCRFRAKADGQTLPSESFGPNAGLSRVDALEAMLHTLWTIDGSERPEWSFLEYYPPEGWAADLSERVERPKKYVRNK